MSNFVNNIVKLMSGSMIAQFIGILLFPIISRIYSPSDFGVFQLFISISSILVIVSCFTYHLSIMLPKKDEDSANIVVLCLILLLISSVASGFIFIPFSDEIANILNASELADYLLLLPVIVFLSGLFIILNYWSSRKVRFGVVAKSRIANVLSSKLSQVGIGSFYPSPIGLLTGYFIGFLLANMIMLINLKSDMQYFKNVSVQNIKRLAIRYQRFPKYSMWSLLANTTSFQLAPFMLAYYFSSATVGYYSFANQILALPVSLIGGATSQVFFQKASEIKNNNGNFKKLVTEVHGKLISIGIFPLIVFMIIGENLFSFFLGSEWYTAGIYAKILAPWIFLRFIYSPISSVFDILEKQNMELVFNTMMICSIFVSLFIGGKLNNPILALVLLSCIGIILWGAANIYLLYISDVSLINEFKFFVKYLLLASLISTPLVVVKHFNGSLYTMMFFSFVLLIAYYIILIYQDVTLKTKLFKMIKR